MKLSICADILYWGKDFCEKLEPIKEAGADVIEFWSWAGKDIEKAKEIIDKNNMKVLGFCVSSADHELEKKVQKKPNILVRNF